jgi:hypothetical protein
MVEANMTVDRDEASALLHDVEGIETRVRELLVYARVSDYLFLWGAIWLFGFTASYFVPIYADTMWLGLETVGLIGTVLIVATHSARGRPRNLFVIARASITVVAIIVFGTLWSTLAHMGWREHVTFWPTLLSFLLFLMGLWAGRALAFAAFAIFSVSLAGYFIAGPYLLLWMAVAVGGAMIAGGFWLRR